jgi:hypothetical protein
VKVPGGAADMTRHANNARDLQCADASPGRTARQSAGPRLNQLHDIDVEEARHRVRGGDPRPHASKLARSRS